MVWGLSAEEIRAFLLKKRIGRLIRKEHFLALCAPLLKFLNILTLPSLYILEAALTVKKVPKLLITNQEFHNKMNTRYINMLRFPEVNNNLARSSPQYQCIYIFNKLPKLNERRNHWECSRGIQSTFLLRKLIMRLKNSLRIKNNSS